MTPKEAFELTEEVTREYIAEVDDSSDAEHFAVGEAAQYLADLDMLPLTRRAALQGIVAALKDSPYPDLFDDEKELADRVAEALNVGL